MKLVSRDSAMPRETMADLVAFLAVARERSFTRAAAQLGVSPSALSHTVRKLEERIGVRLLTRTTRSVSPTEAGERLLRTIGPHFDEVRREVEGLSELRDKPAGTIRITSADHPGRDHPLAGVGEAPAAISGHPRRGQRRRRAAGHRRGRLRCRGPAGRAGRQGHDRGADRPRRPHGRRRRAFVFGEARPPAHAARPCGAQCINLRLRTLGGIYAWEFEKGGREMKVRVEGQVTFNDARLIIKAARAGLGLAYVFRDTVEAEMADGALIAVLSDWTPPFAGYHLYYPSRRQQSPAFALLVEALRFRG